MLSSVSKLCPRGDLRIRNQRASILCPPLVVACRAGSSTACSRAKSIHLTIGYSCAPACTVTGLQTFLAASPLLLVEVGRPRRTRDSRVEETELQSTRDRQFKRLHYRV